MEIYRDSEITLGLSLVGATNISAIVSRNNTQLYTTTNDPFDLPLSITAQEGKVVVVWTFDYAGEVGLKRTESYDVVTPYASIDELRALGGVLATKSDDELKTLEQTARYIINNFCGQSFGQEYKTITLTVNPGVSFTLPTRTWQIDSITTSFDPATNLIGSTYLMSSDGYTVDPYRDVAFYSQWAQPWDYDNILVTGAIQAPSLFPFERDWVVTVTGWFGWESVPSDINWATKALAITYSNNDNLYRQRSVNTVTSQTWNLQFTDDASLGTGNIDVDKVLSSYFVPQLGVI